MLSGNSHQHSDKNDMDEKAECLKVELPYGMMRGSKKSVQNLRKCEDYDI